MAENSAWTSISSLLRALLWPWSRLYSFLTLSSGSKDQYDEEKAIPLVLPSNCAWDAQTGTYVKKTDVDRTTLNVIPEALDQLTKIKEPVCVVSIAGPCRKGKSYILSEAFDQGKVFPLGHLLDPETMGIWLWVVPQKFKDSTGQDFTVVLLDSEGIDSVYAKQADDHRIFTLSVLLSSILIYNSAGVPNRSDLEGLDFIVKLSQQIELFTKTEANAGRDGDESHFYKTFPNFIWLLRDVVLQLPAGCTNIKEYFLKNVLNASNKDLNEKAKNTAESIFEFFSAFDAFALPPPTLDPEVLKSLKESEVNPKFLRELQAFKKMIHSKLSPKQSINEGEFVTGEALAALIQLFVEAINTPGTVPNVENAWDTFVHNKCTEVLAAALATYKQEMTSRVKDKIPCQTEVIRAAHLEAVDVGFDAFNQETFTLSIKSTDKYLNKLKKKAEAVLSTWIEKNTNETEACCNQLLKELKQSILDPVLKRLHGPEGAKMQFSDIANAYDQIQESYKAKARGAKDVQATVFTNFHPELKREMEQNIDILQKMKDYNESLTKEKAEKAAHEEKRLKAEEQSAKKEEENQILKKKMALLQEKQEEEKIRLQQVSEKNLKDLREQLTNMKEANFRQQQQVREAALALLNNIGNAALEASINYFQQNLGSWSHDATPRRDTVLEPSTSHSNPSGSLGLDTRPARTVLEPSTSHSNPSGSLGFHTWPPRTVEDVLINLSNPLGSFGLDTWPASTVQNPWTSQSNPFRSWGGLPTQPGHVNLAGTRAKTKTGKLE